MINILLCGNSGYIFDGALTTLLSITNHCRDALNVYLFTMDATHLNPKFTPITDEEANYIDYVLKQTNPESKATKYDVTNLYNKLIGGSPNENTPYTPYALLRLLADQIENVPNKLLYLDTDLMFTTNIHKLYDIDVTDYEYAASLDHYGKVLLKRDYINTGVILFNMAKIKETKLFEKARALLNKKKMAFPDQSAIYNCTTSKLILPQRFNSQKYLNKKTVVRHFAKTLKTTPYPRVLNIKPWNVTDIHKYYHCHQFDDVLYEYIYFKKFYEKQIKGKQNYEQQN